MGAERRNLTALESGGIAVRLRRSCGVVLIGGEDFVDEGSVFRGGEMDAEVDGLGDVGDGAFDFLAEEVFHAQEHGRAAVGVNGGDIA